MKRSVEERIVGRLAEFTEDLGKDRPISEKYVVRNVRKGWTAPKLGAEGVRKTRRLLGLDRDMFAAYLGVTARTVQAWEKGTKAPNRMACRFMREIVRGCVVPAKQRA